MSDDGLLGSVGPGAAVSGDLGASDPDVEDVEFIELTDERYALGNLLGEGGMGRVVVAEDKVLRRQVALKGLKARGEGARRRLAREAWITARLDHPGIVAVHDAGRLPDGTPFYTMRLVRGRSLEDAIAQAPELQQRLGLVRPLLAACEAVAYAHQAGIVHRDLKPANILLGGFGETQVVDWGLARPLHEAEERWDLELDGDAQHTRAGAVVGTPAFMAPEQARGEPADKRSDVFALGATLFVLLTGQPLRGADSDAALQLAREGHLPDLAALQPDAPPELVAIARRALHPDPERRYPDAAGLAQDLVNWFEGRRVDAHHYTPAQLALRLLQAWRTPIAAALLVLSVVVIAATTTTLRVAEQRDRAVDAEQEARDAERLA
ncbi:MAG: serine/threonine protein kinase [Alphaproteobacteria bacterium]|nr:serine/threonine protein kinase [Alphaproteobacteria bacterium]MCB9795100.1 serine/threonine protein kinase [Alphaproteobacteria bacterium]